MAADRHNSPLGGDEWIAVALIGAVMLATGVWCGAQLSTLVTTGGWLDASIGDAVGAMVRIPGHASHPADAWPVAIRADVAGPTVYWLMTALVLGGQIGAVRSAPPQGRSYASRPTGDGGRDGCASATRSSALAAGR